MKQWIAPLPKEAPADGKSHFVLAVKDARGHRLEFKGQIDAKVAADLVQMVVTAAAAKAAPAAEAQPQPSGQERGGVISGADRTTGGWIGQP